MFQCNFKMFLAKKKQIYFYLINYVFIFVHSFLLRKRTYLKPSIHCTHLNRRPQMHIIDHNHQSSARLRIDPKVLVLVETTYSRLGREIAELLVHNRIK